MINKKNITEAIFNLLFVGIFVMVGTSFYFDRKAASEWREYFDAHECGPVHQLAGGTIPRGASAAIFIIKGTVTVCDYKRGLIGYDIHTTE